MLKIVLFDLDGTLVDATDLHYQALNQALVSRGYPRFSREDHISKYNGLPTMQKLALAGLDDEEAFSLNVVKQRLTVELIEDEIKPTPGLVNELKALKDRHIKTGCVTNCSRHTATLMLAKAGLLDLMDVLVTNEDVKSPKPDPEGYLKAMMVLGGVPADTLIFEDSEKGIVAAEATGCEYYVICNSEQLVEVLKGV